MGYLDTFRILEKTTLSGATKYIPQVLVFKFDKVVSGMLWWKKTEEVEVYYGFMREAGSPFPNLIMDKATAIITFNSNNNKIVNYQISEEAGLDFDSLENAKLAINNFKACLKIREEKHKAKTFKPEIKIIEL